MAAAPLAAASQRPNIILVLADDLGYGDLGCYGQKRIRTPHLDRMAGEGMRFTQAYSGSTVCAPSRCCLMTGLHNGHGRVRDNIPHEIFLRPNDVTVAEMLKGAGYRTGAIGKWSLGEPGSMGMPNMQGFDDWFGYFSQDQAHTYYPESLWDNRRQVLLMGNRANARRRYSPDLFLDRAETFVRSSAKAPFFLYYAPTLPHWSDYPRNSVMSQDVPSDAPYASQNWPQVEKNYAAMVTRLDAQVGRILDLLKSRQLESNTLVLFASDNGPSAEALHRPAYFQSAGPFRGVKRDMYEGGIRVPLLARWKGAIPEGRTSDDVVAFWDFLPTAAEIAGLPAPQRTDGISFLPSLFGKPKRAHEYLYWDYGHVREAYSQAVRLGDWKAVRKRSSGPVELYDLATDIGEARDVAEQHPELAARLRKIMESAAEPSGDYPIREAVQQ